jgi:phosphoribosylamine--glycine ligase
MQHALVGVVAFATACMGAVTGCGSRPPVARVRVPPAAIASDVSGTWDWDVEERNDEGDTRVEREVLVPMLDAMNRSFGRYEGCLYAGIMLTAAGPKVLEFNARFGDPETQPLMMRLRGDLAKAMELVCRHRLGEAELSWDPRPAVCVVMASGGYPDKYQSGYPITGIDQADALADVKVFHAGTAMREGQLVNAGGRVLGVTALGETIAAAQKRAYEAVAKINWQDCYYRRDIAEKAIGGRR